MTARQTVMPLVVPILSLPGLVQGFKPLFSSDSITHRYITRIAILRKTAEVCRDIAASNGLDFTLTVSWKDTLKKKYCESSDAFRHVCFAESLTVTKDLNVAEWKNA